MAALACISVAPTANVTLDLANACSSSPSSTSCPPVARTSHLHWRLCLGGDHLRASPLFSRSIASSPSTRPPRCGSRSTDLVSSTYEIPTVAATKSAFLSAFKKPIPSIYCSVIQDLLVQQHLMRYNITYRYDSVFALGYVTVYDQLMDGYPSSEDREAIFRAYISALNEDPQQYRVDATKLEEWASAQSPSSLVAFASQEGEVADMLKDIAERAKGKTSFRYTRFFAIGLFRLLECAKASDPAVLDQLCTALNVSKISVDRDLDVYRTLLSKLAQSKELMKEYLEREKKKQAERESEKIMAKSE